MLGQELRIELAADMQKFQLFQCQCPVPICLPQPRPLLCVGAEMSEMQVSPSLPMPEGPLPVPVATFVTKLWCILEKRDYHDAIRWSEVKNCGTIPLRHVGSVQVTASAVQCCGSEGQA